MWAANIFKHLPSCADPFLQKKEIHTSVSPWTNQPWGSFLRRWYYICKIYLHTCGQTQHVRLLFFQDSVFQEEPSLSVASGSINQVNLPHPIDVLLIINVLILEVNQLMLQVSSNQDSIISAARPTIITANSSPMISKSVNEQTSFNLVSIILSPFVFFSANDPRLLSDEHFHHFVAPIT